MANYELSGHFGYRRILRATTPSILTMIVVSMYSIVDGLFISNFAGTTAFAAVNLVMPALFMLGSLGMMIGAGGSALVSKTMGEGYGHKANRIFTMLVQTGVVLGTALGAAYFVLAQPVARALGADEAMMADCVLYGRLCALAMPMLMMQMVFQSLYVTAGKPQLGTIMSAASGVINIVLDAILVAWLKTGVTGAALATDIAQIVSGLFPIIYFARQRDGALLRLTRTRWIGRYVRQACTNGLSEYVGNIALNVVSICYNLQLMRLIGQAGVAAYGIIMYLGFIYAAVFIGFNLGIAPVIGFNYGAQNRPELQSLLRKSLTIIMIYSLAMTATAELTGSWLARIFVGYDPHLTAITTHAIRLYFISYLLCGVNMFASTLFTALGNGLVSAAASFARTLVFELGCVFILPALLGTDGIWLAVDVAELLAFIMVAILIPAYNKRYGYIKTAPKTTNG